ncbi:hypothetical protein GCM10025865_22860 [Paraoerskovia sediminicola]|uniref:DUF8094 domain-containing protein n=1 Tax=Paraoerskovia sediminicola TaxID=1138587 RepID=A0ABN6XDN4_9CELL|nr:hypothetical protein [Paraoerskovia sediminicola]BDZ42987.1 hypothetical protein GCM10025865_22860 [Paraoerskovia sediminicola]
MSATKLWRPVAASAVGLTVLAGCASPVPEPDPADPPAEAQAALTQSQEEDVRDAIAAALKAADEAEDAEELKGRVDGPALATRKAQISVAAKADKESLVTDIPADVQQSVVPAFDGWPRTGLAVSVEAEDSQSPRLMVVEQPDARADYELWAWVKLFPDTTLPTFAESSVGSPPVAADDGDTLVMSPDDALAQYIDVLNVGEDSSYADSFDDDLFRSLLEEQDKVLDEALEPADGKHTTTFKKTDDALRSVRTVDGGAVVTGAMTAREKYTAEEGAKIQPQTDAEKALFGDEDASEKLNVDSIAMVSLFVPAADAEDQQVSVLGVERTTTKVSN